MNPAPPAIFAAAFFLVSAGVHAQSPHAAADGRLVIAKISAQFGINSKVITHLDLTEPFQTKPRWSLVVAKQPDDQSSDRNGGDAPRGLASICFLRNGQPDCSPELFLRKYRDQRLGFETSPGPFYEISASDIVFSAPGNTLPLLRIKTCTIGGATGNCGVSTFLINYDRNADKFFTVFFKQVGRNNNEEVRFVEQGPLLGSVIVTYPTSNAPFGYYVEVYQRPSGGQYAEVLRYRSNTRYGDGNPLAVIDSEMPETLRRLGLWKPGDPLPVPPKMPRGCNRLVLRKGVEWCEP